MASDTLNEHDALAYALGVVDAHRDTVGDELVNVCRRYVSQHDDSAELRKIENAFEAVGADLHEAIGSLRARAEKAEAERDRAEARLAAAVEKIEKALALSADRERFVMIGPRAFADVEKLLTEARAAALDGEGASDESP